MPRLILGDTLDVLKGISKDSIDMGVTSPPYNKQENKKGWLVKNVIYDKAIDKQSEENYQSNQIAVLNELFRIIKPGGSFFYNHKIRWEKGVLIHPLSWLTMTKWTLRQEIIWDRTIAGNIRGWRFWQVDERIYWLYKPILNNKIGSELKSKHALLTSIWRFPPEGKSPHPAPFPLQLPLRCILSILDQNSGVVIDPYCGSGTTLVASKFLNCEYIGIDISDEYLKLAQNRLDSFETEREVFEQELSKHKVNLSFTQRKELNMFTGKYKNKVASVLDNQILF
jgi:modification methylase